MALEDFEIGPLIGTIGGTECDSPLPASYADGRCRCIVCGRCGHHTGNSSQGHYWSRCKVTGTLRDFHLCCPDNCELEEGSDSATS